MTVSTELYEVTRLWTGAETVFSTGFVATDAAHVRVTHVVDGATVTLTRGVHYTSRLVPANSRTAAPLEIVPLAMPTAPVTLLITRVTPALQPVDLSTGHYDPAVLERQLDADALRSAERRGKLDQLSSVALTVLPGQTPPKLNVAAFALGALLALGPDGNFAAVRPDAPTGATYAANILDSTAAGRALLTGSLEEQRRLVQTQLLATQIAGTTQSILRTHLETCGYYAPWDGGGAKYRQSLTLPTTTGWQRSAEGIYWELVPDQVVTPQMFGARGIAGFNNSAAFADWANFGGSGYVPRYLYETTTTVVLSKFHTLRSDAAWIVATGTQTIGVISTLGVAGVEAPQVHHRGMLRVYWPVRNWTLDRTGFFTQNAYSSSFEISVYNGTCGLWMNGSGLNDVTGMGNVHNNVYLGEMWNCQSGVRITSQRASGWCNANIIHAGKFYGTATAPEVAAGIYAATCGHIYVEGSPYQNNGNIFLYPSLEWVGPNFPFARLGGFRDRLLVRYMERETALGTWIIITGLEITVEAIGPSAGLYNPYLPGPGQRIDASLATRPNIIGVTNFRSIGSGSDVLWSDSIDPTLKIRNASGPALQLQSGSDFAAIEVRHPTTGALLRTITDGVTEVVNGGANRIRYGNAAPTTGTHAAGDVVRNIAPVLLGVSPNQYWIDKWTCFTGGTPGVWLAGSIDYRP
jgi:hypothetical protein